MHDFADFPITILMMSLAAMSLRTAGYPIGGSLALAKNLHRRYLDLGGEIKLGTHVRKILTEGDRAVGVELQDGTRVRADFVISAADGHSTIFEMLDGRFLSDELRGYYGGGLQPWPGLVQVSLGVARSFPHDTQLVRFHSSTPVIVAGKEERYLGFRHFSDDPTMAPAGKTVVQMSFSTDYSYWKELSSDKERYKAEKERIAAQVIAAMDERYPGFRNSVEEVDVATPATFERYTGNWKGSFEGWLITTKNLPLILKGGGLPKTLPGLGNFSMIGQWTVVGGGLPPAAKDGRDIIKGMCKSDRKRFVTTEV
jgi:phytoene dehydrogenase-like protein